MHSSSFTPVLRHALLLALGLGSSATVGALGCADRGSYAICIDSESDFDTCLDELYQWDVDPDPEGPRTRVERVCFEGGEACEPCDIDRITGAVYAEVERRCSIVEIERVQLGCGPEPAAEEELGQCCYYARVEGDFSCAQEGRPLLASAGAPRLAELRHARTWLAPSLALEGLQLPEDGAVRQRLHDFWFEAARYEHASVAAFARVSAQLLSLGAPAPLLRAASQAMGDEVRHAQLCFSLASAYAEGPPVGAGPLRIEQVADTGMDLESTLREAIFEGALGEGTAALRALEGAQACEDPIVREVLLRIAEDEQRHALLAYQTVQWALRAYPRQARALVGACLREGHELAPRSAEPETQALGRYGLLDAGQRSELGAQTWLQVVEPLLRTMMDAEQQHAALA